MTGRRAAGWLILAATAAGCGSALSPLEPLPIPARISIDGPGPHDLDIAVPARTPVLITVSGRDVDVKAALLSTAFTTARYADAPNRRMGVETLLLEAPHESRVILRIARNDHGGAAGSAVLRAVALPLVTAADRRRLEAARLESSACLDHSDRERGAAVAAAFATAAELHRRNGDRAAAGAARLHAGGARYSRLDDWRGAARLALRARRELEGTGQTGALAYALRLAGAAIGQQAHATDTDARARGPLARRARDLLGGAAERFRAIGNAYEAGYALNYRGVSYVESGERERARSDFTAALGLFQSAGDPPAQALSLQSLALMSHEDGRLSEALREFDRALALIPRDEDPENYAHTLHNSALPLRVIGRFDEAIARYDEAGEMLRRLGDRNGEARALHGLGTIMLYAGQSERASELLLAAVRLRGETGAAREQAMSLLLLGQIQHDAGRFEEAITLHQRALRLVSAPHDRAQVLLSLARMRADTGDPNGARANLDSVLKLALPATHRYLGLAFSELATLESEAGRPAAAFEHFADALRVHAANGSDIDQARTLHRRAVAASRAGDARAALADAKSALRLFDDVGVESLHAEGRAAFRASYRDAAEFRIALLVDLATDAQVEGDTRGAQRRLREALTTSERSRAQWMTDSGLAVAARAPAGLLEERRSTYEALAVKRQQREGLQEAARPDRQRIEALSREIALLRARASLLEGRVGGSLPVAQTTPNDERIAAAVSAVPAHTMAVEFFIGRSRSWAFAVADGHVRVHALGPGREIERDARQLHATWRDAAGMAPDRLVASHALARRVFGQLGPPAADATVLIVPDGALHIVPMAVLAREFWPRLAPGSARILPSLAVRVPDAPTGATRPELTLAVIADPVYAADDPRIRQPDAAQSASGSELRTGMLRGARSRESLQRLPATGNEASALLSLAGGKSRTLALVGHDASRERVLSAPLERFRILHFATHAFADGRDPALASLELSRWNERGQPVEGALRLYDVLQLRLNADLVVLSGCDTAVGGEFAGEGPIGLSRAFLQSGARAVIATLWQVPDTSTAVLMREFYRRLLVGGEPTPVALQHAQDHLRRQARWSDPYYWAGFQLVSPVPPDVNNNNVD